MGFMEFPVFGFSSVIVDVSDIYGVLERSLEICSYAIWWNFPPFDKTGYYCEEFHRISTHCMCMGFIIVDRGWLSAWSGIPNLCRPGLFLQEYLPFYQQCISHTFGVGHVPYYTPQPTEPDGLWDALWDGWDREYICTFIPILDRFKQLVVRFAARSWGGRVYRILLRNPLGSVDIAFAAQL